MTIILFIILADYKKGPKLWKKIAPYLYLVLIWTNFIVLPILNSISYAVLVGKNTVLNEGWKAASWIFFYEVL
jgi:hypothetical protein